MGRGLGVIGFPGVSTFRDRHGKPRFRFRRKGMATIYLPGLPGSAEFAAAYADAAAGLKPKREVGAARTMPGTINALVVSYYKSGEFVVLAETTKATYRGILERLRADYGELPIIGLDAARVRRIRDKRAAKPSAANNVLRMLRMILGFAVDRGMLKENAAAKVRPLSIKGDGLHAWTEEEIGAFEERWPVGTRERLALDLLLYTAQRSGDVRQLGPQHVREGFLQLRQGKTGVSLTIPVLPALAASLAATPSGHLTFLVTKDGQPFTPKGFGNWFSAAATAAGLPHCAAHGLRKAAAQRIADRGGSAHQIAAVTGHRTLKEVARYTAQADQKRLASSALEGIGETKPERDLATPAERLANGGRK